MWALNIVLSSFLKWSWIAARNNILHLWQCLEMTSVSLLLPHPFRHVQTTGESWPCVQCVKRKYWKMWGTAGRYAGTSCHKGRLISPFLFEEQSSAKGADFHQQHSLLHTSGAPTWSKLMMHARGQDVGVLHPWGMNLQLLEGPGLSPHLKAPLDFRATQRVDLGLLCVST